MNISAIVRRFPGGFVAATAATVLLTAACGPDESGATGTPAATPTQAAPTKPAGNGIEAKSADEILSAAKAALAAAKSVHVKGTVVESGETINLDLFLGTEGARGTMGAPIEGKTVSVSILSTKSDFYLKSPQMWRAVGGAPMADLIGDRWVLVPKDDSADFKEFEQLTDLKTVANELFDTKGDKVTKGETTVIDGVPAIGLVGSDGTLYVATTGTPYPLKIVPKKPKKPGEELAFLDYDAPLDVAPPANALDLSKLGQ